ncbi:hypothetical protein ACWGIN_22825 [Streptomyces sp. NPDC054861]
MSDSLHEPWLRGIAFNPAAPSDVLMRLVGSAAGEAGLLMCAGRDLPDAVIDAALNHPDRVVRRALARNWHIDPERLAPLATDPSGIVRGWLASLGHHVSAALSRECRRLRLLPEGGVMHPGVAVPAGVQHAVPPESLPREYLVQ